MSVISIRSPDPGLYQTLKKESEEKGTSVNRLVLEVLESHFLPNTSRKRFNDLDHLAGTWSEADYDEFQNAVASVRQIHPGDWQ